MNGAAGPFTEAAYRQALGAFHRGQHGAAVELCEQALRDRPNFFDALQLRAVIALQAQDFRHAAELFGAALSANPNSASAHNLLASALLSQNQYTAALASSVRAVELDPCYADAHYNLGNVHFDMGSLPAAIASYDVALQLNPRFVLAQFNRGICQWRVSRHVEAIDDFDRVLEINPRNPEAWSHRGHALRDSRQFEAALASYAAALECDPCHAEAHNGRGNCMAALHRYEDALLCYGRSIEIRPQFAEAFFNRGNALAELRRFESAIESYNHALEIMPQFAEALYKRGDAQRSIGDIVASLKSLDQAYAIKPSLPSLSGLRCHLRMRLCDWRNLERDVAQVIECIGRGENACMPFAMLSLTGSAAMQLQTARNYVRDCFPPDQSLPRLNDRSPGERIRIAYFSPDFCNHPVSYLMAQVIDFHDRSHFEVYGFSLGPPTRDEMRQRLEQCFDHFLDVHDRSDRDVTLLARSLEIDIAVDLGGFTRGCRPAIFAFRAAPLQVVYLGYLGTLAAPYMDYIIADPVALPSASRMHYEERILYLPNYQPTATRSAADEGFTRAALGLPSSGFVYCCLNSAYKIAPATFAGWMRILNLVPGSVLFLYADLEVIASNLKRAAAAAGIDSARLVFGAALEHAEYLSRYRSMDLFLDTLPYNAGTTASDALWMGVPILTLPGEAVASRMAASILTAAKLPELIAETQEHYEQLAVKLATDTAFYSNIKQRVVQSRCATLLDSPRFTRELERGYRTIYENQLAGSPPTDTFVAPE